MKLHIKTLDDETISNYGHRVTIDLETVSDIRDLLDQDDYHDFLQELEGVFTFLFGEATYVMLEEDGE